MLENLYKKILDKTTNSNIPTENNDKIVIKSKGINGAYSTLSLANNNCQCYLYNLNIQNTLKKDNTINKNAYNFIEEQSVILYWPLNGNTKPLIVNPNYLDDTHNYTFRPNNCNNFIYSSSEFYQSTTVNGLSINYVDSPELPVYLTIDNENVYTSNILTKDNTKINSTQLKNILFNKNGNTPFTTLIHWGYVTNDQAGDLPVISEFNPESNDGFMISPKRIAKYNFGEDIILDTDYASYSNNLLSTWVMYVYEFQHNNIITPGDISEISRNCSME